MRAQSHIVCFNRKKEGIKCALNQTLYEGKARRQEGHAARRLYLCGMLGARFEARGVRWCGQDAQGNAFLATDQWVLILGLVTFVHLLNHIQLNSTLLNSHKLWDTENRTVEKAFLCGDHIEDMQARFASSRVSRVLTENTCDKSRLQECFELGWNQQSSFLRLHLCCYDDN